MAAPCGRLRTQPGDELRPWLGVQGCETTHLGYERVLPAARDAYRRPVSALSRSLLETPEACARRPGAAPKRSPRGRFTKARHDHDAQYCGDKRQRHGAAAGRSPTRAGAVDDLIGTNQAGRPDKAEDGSQSHHT